MKKRNKVYKEEFGPVKVWADDLKKIVSELRGCSRISLATDDYEYDSLEMFIQDRNTEPVTELRISAKSPSVEISLGNFPSILMVYESDEIDEHKTVGLFNNLQAIIKKCERKPRYFYKYGGRVFFLLITLLFVPFQSGSVKIAVYFVTLTGIILMCWLIYVGSGKRPIVYPIQKNDRPGFWRRNRDAMTVNVVSATLGAVAGSLITVLIQHYLLR